MTFQKIILRRGEQLIWVGFLLLLLLLSFTSAGYNSATWMRLSLGLYGLTCLYLSLILLGSPYNSEALARGRPAIALVAASILWLLLQTIIPFDHGVRASLSVAAESPDWFRPGDRISIDPQRTYWLMYGNLVAFCVMLLCMSLLRNRRRLKQLLYLLALAGVIHAISGILAKYSGVYLVDRQQLDGHWSAARGWFINRNHFAAFLIMSTAGCVPFLLRMKGNMALMSYRSLCLVICLLIAFAIVLSESRSGVVGLLVILGLVFILLPSHSGKAKLIIRGNARTGIKLLVASVALLVIVALLFGQELVLRLNTSFLDPGERVIQWQITWQAIQQSPLVGYGGGSYASIFQFFRDDADLRQVVFDQAHNDYLHIWLEQGLVGLLLWLTALGLVFRYAYAQYKRSRSSLVAAVLAGGCFTLIAALLQAGVDFNLQIISLRCYFFVIIGMLLAAPSVHVNLRPEITSSIANYDK